MSAHKVKRLKTPTRDRDSPKHTDSTLLTRVTNYEESKTLAFKSIPSVDPAHMALMAEINNVYEQIAKVKSQSNKYQQLAIRFESEKSQLQTKVGKLTQELANFQQLYQLQIYNHQQLRKFYQLRQLQWKNIVQQHRLLLEQYDRQNATNYSQLQSVKQVPSQLPQQLSQSVQDMDLQSCLKRQNSRRSIRKSSLERNNRSLPKLKLSRQKSKIDGYYKQMSRLYTQESKFALKVQNQYKNIQNDQSKLKSSSKIVEADEFFDKVVRNTYYKYKDQCQTVNDIVNLQDMKKLKNANTSTKQRLLKTLRKLRFQLEGQEQVKQFCQYVEKATLKKYRAFKGDFAFQLLVQKLKECQRLALTSNSQLSKFENDKSKVKDQSIGFKFSRAHRQLPLLRASKSTSEIEKVSNKNMELLINSTIKQQAKVRGSIYKGEVQVQQDQQQSSKIDSRLPIDSFSGSQQGSKYFLFRQVINPESLLI